MDNMNQIIERYNQKILQTANKENNEWKHQWNSRTSECSLENKCLNKNVVYQAK